MNLTEGDWGLFAMSAAMFFIFAGFLIWGIRSGQFKNVEEPKYRMMEDLDKADRDADPEGKQAGDNAAPRKGGTPR